MCLAVQLDEKQASNGLSNKTKKRPLVLYFFVLYFFIRSYFVRYFFEVPFGRGRKILEPIEITSFFLRLTTPTFKFQREREIKLLPTAPFRRRTKTPSAALKRSRLVGVQFWTPSVVRWVISTRSIRISGPLDLFLVGLGFVACFLNLLLTRPTIFIFELATCLSVVFTLFCYYYNVIACL